MFKAIQIDVLDYTKNLLNLASPVREKLLPAVREGVSEEDEHLFTLPFMSPSNLHQSVLNIVLWLIIIDGSSDFSAIYKSVFHQIMLVSTMS